jgi:hypothetical protein
MSMLRAFCADMAWLFSSIAADLRACAIDFAADVRSVIHD